MSTTDFIVDILLIVVIFWQLRPQPYTARTAILPLVVLVWAGTHYLHSFDVGGNDLPLMGMLTLVGLALGCASAATTFMWRDDAGRILARVGSYACLSWIAGMGFRFLFALYASSDRGGREVAEFSRAHDVTGSQAWTTALVCMAFAEVLSRIVILQVRRIRLEDDTNPGPVTSVPEQRRAADDAPRPQNTEGSRVFR
jgi:hypothetical protein